MGTLLAAVLARLALRLAALSGKHQPGAATTRPRRGSQGILADRGRRDAYWRIEADWAADSSYGPA